MDEIKSMEHYLDEFNNLVVDIYLVMKVDVEDKAIILWNSLPKYLKSFLILKYDRETISIDEVHNARNSKLISMKSNEQFSN